MLYSTLQEMDMSRADRVTTTLATCRHTAHQQMDGALSVYASPHVTGAHKSQSAAHHSSLLRSTMRNTNTINTRVSQGLAPLLQQLRGCQQPS
jgi:hypothetical protein